MAEHQPRIPPSQHYQPLRNLARQSHQPYEEDDLDDAPLEEDPHVLPLPGKSRSQESLVEDVILRSGKRKPSSSSQRKAKSTTGKQKTSKSSRSVSAVNHQPFVDELQKLEAQADRINQILAERARKRDREQAQAMSDRSAPSNPSPFSQPQDQGISIPLGNEWLSLGLGQAESEKLVSQSWNPQLCEERRDPRQHQQAKQEAWRTAADLRYLNHSEPVAYRGKRFPGLEAQERPTFRRKLTTAAGSASQSSGFPWRYLRWTRFLEVPRKPIGRISDGVLWVMTGAIVRILSRSILMVFPALSPVLTLLMLTPAMLAVLLVLFAPRMGWMPFYRLFLITLGLLIGGKF